MQSIDQLAQTLNRIDGRGYKAYKDIQGGYRFEGGALFIDHVQADPFAGPSKVRVRVDQTVAQVPGELFRNTVRRVAVEDFLTRQADAALRRISEGGEKHKLLIDVGGQAIVERTACVVTGEFVELRIEVGLPAAGRKVLGQKARQILCELLPREMPRAVSWSDRLDQPGRRHVEQAENHRAIQDALPDRGLVAFVAEGAILPRESGISDKPMDAAAAVLFESPQSLRVTFTLPNPVDGPTGEQKTIEGMGLPQGVSVIVGGGYHGKSTLLRALELGVYPHRPDDGRSFVVTDPDAVKVRAEDRRRVEKVGITPFICDLPNGTDTDQFCTEEASGSTSQAATIVESLEAGAIALLMDEDTCATNLMVRDARMQQLVARDNEPITPLVDRIRALYDRLEVSTILVMGGCGDYFDVADTVLMMNHYRPYDVTEQSRSIAQQIPTDRRDEASEHPLVMPPGRHVDGRSIDPSKGKKQKVDARGREVLTFGTDDVDLRCLDQLTDVSQTRAIGQALRAAGERFCDGHTPLPDLLDRLEALLDEKGLEALNPFEREASRDGGPHPGRLARPRRHEVAAALNRLRSLRTQVSST
jgi:predicted ABC-class ATPase